MKAIYLLIFSTIFFMNSAFSMGTELVSEKKVQEKIKLIEVETGLDEHAKKLLLSLYAKTLDSLEAIKKNKQQAINFNTARKNAPDEIKKFKKELEQLEKNQRKEKTPEELNKSIKNIELTELEQRLNSESANQAAVEAKESYLKQSLEDESSNAPTIRTQLIESKYKLEQLLEDKKLPVSGDSDETRKAQEWLLNAQISALRSELKMLDRRLLSQPLRVQLLELKNKYTSLNLKRINQRVLLLKQQVDFKRSAEIKKNQEITHKENVKSQGKHPLIQSLAQLNSELSEDINRKNSALIKLESDENDSNEETKRLMAQFNNTRKKLNIAGLNQIMGQMLQEQSKSLPDRQLYLKRLDKREQLVALLSLKNIQYHEELKRIKNNTEYATQWMKDVSPEIQSQIQADLIALIQTRTVLLGKAVTIDSTYLKAISALDFSEKKLLNVSEHFAKLLGEHIFWLRSAPVIDMNNIMNIPGQITFILSPSKWNEFLKDFIHMLNYSSIIYPFVLFIIIVLIFQKNKIKQLLVNTGKKTRRISTDRLLYTFKAINYTFLLAVPLPAFFLLTGYQLNKMVYVSEFSHAIAAGLTLIVLPVFSLQLFRYICLPEGLAEIHFKWSREIISGLRKILLRMMMTLIPAIFISAVLTSKDVVEVNGGLGRLALVVVMIAFAIFFFRLLKPETGLLSAVAKKDPKSIFARFQGLWFFLSLLSVMIIMGLTLVGYVFTAGKLTLSLMETIWLIFALVLLQQLSLRWLLLIRRKYALKKAYEKRKSAQALRNKEKGKDNKGHMIDFEEPEINIISLSEESNKLLNFLLFILCISGLALIWMDIFPALSIFEKVEFWHRKGVVDGIEKIMPVTLKDVFFAILVAIITIVGGKRFPAIIEIIMLQANVNSGNRYAAITLINYAIIGIGFFVVFNILGADWAQFQWMFAALSVGIGFGLQEIVANFISGIIILFERPIRIGDYVTVGDNEGIVSRIQIRATTIMTRDRKELLVPNKEFITGQLLNWSLSDPTARLIIPIGVAYGSDIPLARQLLLSAAVEHERVSDEPVPQVLFFGFGDNTLDLQLRCFIPDMDYRLKTISELNEMINDKFNDAGINIAFPQRDVHLDINQPIDVRLRGASD